MIFFTDDNLPLFTYCMCTHTLLKSISRERELKRVFFKRMRYKYNVKIGHKLIRTVQHQQLSLNIFFLKKDQFTLSIDSKSQQQQREKTEPIENIYLYFNKIKSIKN